MSSFSRNHEADWSSRTDWTAVDDLFKEINSFGGPLTQTKTTREICRTPRNEVSYLDSYLCLEAMQTMHFMKDYNDRFHQKEKGCILENRSWIAGNMPLSNWNHLDTDDPRINNHLEGWHGKLKQIINKAHTNIFEMI